MADVTGRLGAVLWLRNRIILLVKSKAVTVNSI